MKKLFIYLLCCCPVLCMAQTNGAITVKAGTTQQAAAENITVELLRADSSLVKAALTNTEGIAVFDNLPYGTYRIKATLVNHTPSYSTPVLVAADNPAVTLPAIVLAHASTELQGVTVSAKKPFVQRLTDRIVVNVENSIVNAGSTAMDVLERSPGVRVGQGDAISLAGKAGVIIMINGKIVPMSGEELGNYLRSLPSSSIERIDLITNPSSRYDAAGNAGIIDIRMKKDQRLGTNGTASAGYGQGRYPKANTGLTLNHRSKKLNIFGNANYNQSVQFNNIETQRYFFNNGDYTGSYDQYNRINRRAYSWLARAGADYTLTNKTIIGVLVTGSEYRVKRKGNNESMVLDEDNVKSSSFLSTADGKENYKNYVVNANLKHTFDSTGRELTVDIDKAGYYRDWASDFATGYYDLNNQPLQPLFLARADQNGSTSLNTLKADYTHPLSKQSKMEAGIKTSFVRSLNDVFFYDRSNGANELDSSQSNSFEYKENINAAYLNYSREWKKWSIQAGLRAEHTHIITYQVFDKVKLDSSYLKLFPSAFVNYKLKEDESIGVSVSRRIDRPGYNQLNPFRIFVDPSFYAAGDPQLKPAFTWSYELNYTRKQINLTLAYSRTVNPLTTVLIPSETQERITIQTPINLGSFDYLGVNFNTPIRISKWWNVINNGNIYFGHNKGYIARTVVDKKTMNAQFSTNHTITISKTWSGEASYIFDSGNNTGVMKDKAYHILGAGVQKTLFAKKGTLRLNVTDILWRQWPRFRSIYTNYHEYVYVYRDTRVVNLNFTYRFGNNKVQAARRRTTASEEERRRAG